LHFFDWLASHQLDLLAGNLKHAINEESMKSERTTPQGSDWGRETPYYVYLIGMLSRIILYSDIP